MKFKDFSVGQLEALVVKTGGPARAMFVLQGELVLTVSPKSTAEPRTYRILGPVEAEQSQPFSADETFLAKEAKTGVKIAYRGGNFKTWFAGVAEEATPTKSLTGFNLMQMASGDEIVADLGGEAVAEVALSQVWGMLKQQPTGQPGRLLTNGHANLFVCRDKTGALRVVCVYWSDGGWDVDAFDLGFRCYGGRRVFSCNS